MIVEWKSDLKFSFVWNFKLMSASTHSFEALWTICREGQIAQCHLIKWRLGTIWIIFHPIVIIVLLLIANPSVVYL